MIGLFFLPSVFSCILGIVWRKRPVGKALDRTLEVAAAIALAAFIVLGIIMMTVGVCWQDGDLIKDGSYVPILGMVFTVIFWCLRALRRLLGVSQDSEDDEDEDGGSGRDDPGIDPLLPPDDDDPGRRVDGDARSEDFSRCASPFLALILERWPRRIKRARSNEKK